MVFLGIISRFVKQLRNRDGSENIEDFRKVRRQIYSNTDKVFFSISRLVRRNRPLNLNSSFSRFGTCVVIARSFSWIDPRDVIYQNPRESTSISALFSELQHP